MRALPILILTLATSAAAQPASTLTPKAQAHLDAFLKAYGEKDYDTALKELDLAYAIDPSPLLLYSKAQTLRLANRCADAIPVYRQFLGEKISSDQTEAAKAGIATCEKLLAARPPDPKPDVKPPDPKPDPKPAPTSDATSDPKVDMVHAPVSPSETRRWWKDPIGGALVGVGAIAVGAGIVFRLRGGSSERAAQDAEFRDEFLTKLDDAERQKRIGAISLIGGGALIAAGVFTYVLRSSGGKDKLAVGTSGRGLFVVGSF